MSTNKTLSVSIAAYNAQDDLDNCIESFMNTGVEDDIELIIVNDGSKDQTKAVAENLEKKYPGIVRVINKENGGHGSTINASIKAATGKYFKVVDSDDWVDAKGLTSLVLWLKNNDVDLVINPFVVVDAKSLNPINTIYPYGNKNLKNKHFSDDVGGCCRPI